MTTNKKQVNQRDINNIKKGKLMTKFEMKRKARKTKKRGQEWEEKKIEGQH